MLIQMMRYRQNFPQCYLKNSVFDPIALETLGYYLCVAPCAGICHVRALQTIRFRFRLEIEEVNHVLWAHFVFHSFCMEPGIQ